MTDRHCFKNSNSNPYNHLIQKESYLGQLGFETLWHSEIGLSVFGDIIMAFSLACHIYLFKQSFRKINIVKKEK